MELFLKPYAMMQRQTKSSLVLPCTVLGLLFSLGLPPFHYWAISIIALSVFFHFYVVSAKPKAVFNSVFVFSLSYFSISSYWIVNAFLVVINNNYLGYFTGGIALLFVSVFMALITAVFVSVPSFLANKLNNQYICILLIPVAWSVSEYVRSIILGGLPMHYVGYMFGNSDYLIQLGSLMNVYVVSFFIVLISLLLSHGFRSAGLGLCLFGGCLLFGIYRVDHMPPDRNKTIKEIKVRLVNANLTQSQLIQDQNSYRIVDKYIKLSTNISAEEFIPDLIIWPESVLRFYVDQGPMHKENRSYLSSFLKREQRLITGAPRYEYAVGNNIKYYSSMVQLGSKGELLDVYDKHRLVPWGEFIPYRELIPDKLANIFDVKDYYPGEGPLTLNYKDTLEILPLICAEGHYPEMLSDYQKEQDLIVMIGNEAWFAGTTEPSQYMVNARYRAVESGLPVLLASNKGYLAIIDKKGIVQNSIYEHKPNVLDGTLKVELN